ncbi:MAG: SusC/RagA family protein [Bacteroidales bacterium 45-6]|nr:MAG: SusC/RagA family protein [Bacteroidales bacterium 45-6]
MKHIQTRFILCAIFAFSLLRTEAQTIAENGPDSLDNVKKALVQLAYQKVPKSDVLGSVSVVNMEELLKKNYNTYSLDNMQGYVGGWNGNSLWAMDDYLVLIDGVPRDANNVLPTEIEQISFLKSASSVVLYGSRAAKGVIYITTKRGKTEPLKISAQANTGFFVSKRYPKYLGSSEYMTLYNEALANDGQPSAYSQEKIYNTSTGLNPYRYPDVDFYSSEYLRKAYNRSDVTTEISGGNERARFYTNVSYYRQGDVFKFGEAKNNNISRLNVRGNVDLTISQNVTAYVNANATFYDSRSANTTDADANDGVTDNYWTYASKFRPNIFAPLIPTSYVEANDVNSWTLINSSSNIIDGKYFLGGRTENATNVFADYYAGGNSKWTSRQFQFDTGINIDLNNFLKGLSFNTQFAVDYATSYTTSYSNSYAVYIHEWKDYNGADVISKLTKIGNDKRSGTQNISGTSDRQTIAFSGQFNYKTRIGEDHNFSAMLIAAGYQRTQSAVYHRTSNANLGLNLNYNFKGKYFAEFGAAEVHSAKLAEGHRNAFSPSLTLGWKLDKESFLANSPVIDNLMISASSSVLHTDLDISDYYMYAGNYTQSDGAWWGWFDGASERSTNSRLGANKNLTFIKRKEVSINLNTSLWKKLVTVDASFFVNTIEGLVTKPITVVPNYFSTGYPNASFASNINFNNNKRTGIDFNVNLNKKIGEVDLTLGLAGTYYTSKATKRDENYEYAYQNRTGKAIDGLWGLVSDGFFKDANDVSTSPTQSFGKTKQGDIKYVDQNNDQVINEKDEVYLGKGGWYGAPLVTGINLTSKWKDFTFFVLCTGSFGAKAFKSNTYWWVYGDRKYSEVVRGRWTPETAETASYPRLTTESSDNNFRNSDFWLYKTDRFDLAKVQLTYDLPKSMLHNSFMHAVSAYVSGANLLTIAKERKLLEMSVASAPQTRFYNVGVKVVF